MTINRVKCDLVKRRRELVGQLRARGMTTREIAEALAHLKDPINVSHVTIAADLNVIRKIWQDNAQVAISEHVEREFAELQEAKREARQNNDLDAWARLFALEMKLLGTDAPQKYEDWTGQDWREYAKQHNIDEADVIAQAERIAAGYSRQLADAAGDGPGRATGGADDAPLADNSANA